MNSHFVVYKTSVSKPAADLSPEFLFSLLPSFLSLLRICSTFKKRNTCCKWTFSGDPATRKMNISVLRLDQNRVVQDTALAGAGAQVNLVSRCDMWTCQSPVTPCLCWDLPECGLAVSTAALLGCHPPAWCFCCLHKQSLSKRLTATDLAGELAT